MTRTSLRGRVETLEARPGLRSAETLIVLISSVSPTRGMRDAWDEHHPEVEIGYVRHAVGADETARQAVHRIVEAIRPAPLAVVATIPAERPQ